MDASRQPPYFTSVGNQALSFENGIVEFWMSSEGHVTEISKRNLIGFEAILQVANAFLIHGTRPETLIDWETE
jgi:hypothetical protein